MKDLERRILDQDPGLLAAPSVVSPPGRDAASPEPAERPPARARRGRGRVLSAAILAVGVVTAAVLAAGSGVVHRRPSAGPLPASGLDVFGLDGSVRAGVPFAKAVGGVAAGDEP
jgi:hypothetical protein